MGFYEDILMNYGREAQMNFKVWNSLTKKLTNMCSRRIFLLRCRKHDVFPKHVVNQFKSLDSLYEHGCPFNKDVSELYSLFKSRVQNLEIKITIWKISNIREKINNIINILQNIVPIDIINGFEMSQKVVRNKLFCCNRDKLLKKFDCLLYQDNNNGSNSNKLFVNRTDRIIPVDVIQFLSYGDKFSLNYNKSDFPLDDLISDLELGFELIDNESERNMLRTKCVNQITNYVIKLDNNKTLCKLDLSQNLLFNKTKTFLKNNKDIIITKADKGNITVAVDRKMYNSKINELLQDSYTYKISARDPTSTLQNKCNGFIQDLTDANYIDKYTCNKLKTHNSIAPRIYGLPKIHKDFSLEEGDPLRPIVSCINSPCYNLPKYFNNILNKITDKHEYDLSNSMALKNILNMIKLDDDDILVSFDAQALFTNIPADKIIDLIKQRWEEIKPHTKMPMGLFLEILKFIFDSGYFVHNGIIFKQIFGTPMGGPISLVLAKILMNDLIVNSIGSMNDIKLIKVYIDDLLVILPRDKVDHTLGVLNSYHERLKFTVEKELDNRLPFLDLMIYRMPNGNLITNWYRKPCSSGRMINFLSNQPYHQKINCAYNFISKVLSLSDESFHDSNKKIITEILSMNQFPNSLIKNLINKTTASNKSEITINSSPAKTKMTYIKLPYIKNLSENINKIFRNSTSIICTYYNKKKVGNLYTNLKDSIPKELQSNFIYKTKCLDCPATYIGCSTQYFKARMYQHKNSIKMKKKNTALATHSHTEKHNIDVENSSIIRNDKDERKLKWLEMLFIKKTKNTINHRTDIAGCLNVYDNVYNKVYKLT